MNSMENTTNGKCAAERAIHVPRRTMCSTLSHTATAVKSVVSTRTASAAGASRPHAFARSAASRRVIAAAMAWRSPPCWRCRRRARTAGAASQEHLRLRIGEHDRADVPAIDHARSQRRRGVQQGVDVQPQRAHRRMRGQPAGYLGAVQDPAVDGAAGGADAMDIDGQIGGGHGRNHGGLPGRVPALAQGDGRRRPVEQAGTDVAVSQTPGHTARHRGLSGGRRTVYGDDRFSSRRNHATSSSESSRW